MTLKTRNLFKLATKEDPIHLHKILGVSCLLNYIYQFYHLFVYGSMYLKDNPYTPLLMGIHAGLSLSSFIFHVPLNRHKGLPMIYKESRLHAIVFSLRSVFCTLAFYYKLDLAYNIFFINLTMVLADLATSKYEAATKTMRGMPFGKDISENDKKSVTYSNSVQQFGATMFMTCNIETAFTPMFAIQLAAFLMTLVRKAIISELDWHRIYAISLWLNVFVHRSHNDFGNMMSIIIGIYMFDYLRIQRGFSKYYSWNLIFIILYLAKTYDIFTGILDETQTAYFINSVIIYYLARNIYMTRALWI